jgi:hypothetical protein
MTTAVTTNARQRAEALGLIDPFGAQKPEASGAPRLATFEGKRIGLLDNRKGNADHLLQALASRLQTQYGAGEVIIRQKATYSRQAQPEILEELARDADFVIAAIGD